MEKVKHTLSLKARILFICCLIYLSCQEESKTIASNYTFIEPMYNDIQLEPQSDSLHFVLDENTYNQIKSFNCFEHNGTPFVSFYDRRSESINIYDFLSQRLIKRIELKSCLPDQPLRKTSVYVKNMDSIFIANFKELYLLDSSGVIQKSIKFFNRADAIAFFENPNPIIIEGNLIYMSVRPDINETSFKSIREWRALYKFDFENESRQLLYSVPEIYTNNIYGDNFLKYSYCYNNKGNFVFSFPADTNIYETNLTNYHKAYYGKSKFQNGLIKPVSKTDLLKDNGFKQYSLRDSYGPIYFDPYKKRYLRLARQKMSESVYESNKGKRKYNFIIFNETFKIIGEGEIADGVSYSSIFFRPDGSIYARTKASDEYVLHFVRLAYKEKQVELLQIPQSLSSSSY